MRQRGGRERKGLQIKRLIYIFTEGHTEKNYFKLLRKKYNASMYVTVKVKPTGLQGMTLLNYAKNSISNLSTQAKKDIEAVYIIFDKDDLSVKNVENTILNAQKDDIKIGYSNICFELWLLSHFEKLTSFIDKKKLYQKLESYLQCDQYEEKHKDDYDLMCHFEDNISNALINCKAFPELNQISVGTNPYTNMGNVIRDIFKQEIY